MEKTKEQLIEEAVKKLKKVNKRDQEVAHLEADDILCELLVALGCKQVVDAFDKIPKWYA